MRKNMLSKILVMGIVVLFICVSFQPVLGTKTIKSVTEEEFNDNELTEVIIETYGIKDVKKNTFYLTNEETEKLDLILTDSISKIDNATSIEESEIILNNTLDELTELGLINGDEIKENIKISKEVFKKIGYATEEIPIEQKADINYLVLISLRANYAVFMPSYIAFIYRIIMDYDYYKENHPLLMILFDLTMGALAIILGILLTIFGDSEAGILAIVLLCALWVFFNPFPIGYAVSLYNGVQNNYGWVSLIGLLGYQKVEGEYRGALGGFTGLRIFHDSDFYMFGFALASAIEGIGEDVKNR